MLEWLASRGATQVEEFRLAEESVRFSLPPDVRSIPVRAGDLPGDRPGDEPLPGSSN
jgi:hypothetical protein